VKPLLISTLVVWGLSLWCGIGVFRSGGPFRRLKRFLGAIVFGVLGILLAALLVMIHVFHAFSGETLVAQVTTRRISPMEFELTYTPRDEHHAGTVHAHLQGNQWSISGGVVKWHPWLTAVGLQSYHKPIRLSGQFSNAQQQRRHLPSLYLLEPSGDQLWEILYRAAPYLPLIDAVYGSSAYVYVEPGTTQAVYVTPFGYLIKRTQTP